MEKTKERKPRVVRSPDERRKAKMQKLDRMREQILFKQIQNKTREYRKTGDPQVEHDLLALMDRYAEAIERNES